MERLKLRAEDIEDVTILSAYLQDAITMMADIVYQQPQRRFVMMLNRYLWEGTCESLADSLPEENCCRIRTGLHFDDVLGISSRNIVPTVQDHPLELLSIEAWPTETGHFLVDFTFAGDGIIRLKCESISAHIKDIGDPWPAKCHPKHDIINAGIL